MAGLDQPGNPSPFRGRALENPESGPERFHTAEINSGRQGSAVVPPGIERIESGPGDYVCQIRPGIGIQSCGSHPFSTNAEMTLFSLKGQKSRVSSSF